MAKRKKDKVPSGDQLLEANRRAKFDYEILRELEAGIVLCGSEVKSVRDGKISLAEAFCQFERGELYLHQAHIAEYPLAHRRNHPAMRRRKLLLHRRELDKLERDVSNSGMAIIPLSVYVKNRHIKVAIALGRGKKQHDKRHTIKAREHARDMDRAIRDSR